MLYTVVSLTFFRLLFQTLLIFYSFALTLVDSNKYISLIHLPKISTHTFELPTHSFLVVLPYENFHITHL
ncbi:hypothetical protein AN467_09845 [Pseudomonas aeruginosa]|nr:hypothetical protein AN455_28515 [Pseudomonas aeruginosa]KRV13653.1 hypothetical protein AN456_28390 [Pseudomonas aeruginosa]OFC05646.1 hypothetical protein AN467_09845 [Pseudomonas aeruginosa]